MNFLERLNKKGDKIFFYYDYGREKGQRPDQVESLFFFPSFFQYSAAMLINLFRLKGTAYFRMAKAQFVAPVWFHP